MGWGCGYRRGFGIYFTYIPGAPQYRSNYRDVEGYSVRDPRLWCLAIACHCIFVRECWPRPLKQHRKTYLIVSRESSRSKRARKQRNQWGLDPHESSCQIPPPPPFPAPPWTSPLVPLTIHPQSLLRNFSNQAGARDLSHSAAPTTGTRSQVSTTTA